MVVHTVAQLEAALEAEMDALGFRDAAEMREAGVRSSVVWSGGAGAQHQDCPLSTSVQSNEIVFCISKIPAGPSPSRI